MSNILSLEVKNYQRFGLNSSLQQFIYTPKTKVQVILGSNSSGKTSLISLLTLWPIDPNELEDDGHVIITVEHNGCVFKLSTNKEDGKTKYGFIIDGNELNTLGRVTVQKELITKYFKVTQQIHSILIGDSKFTSMSPTERKRWFIEMADVDYDYILGVYKKIQMRNNYLKNVISHSSKRLVNENEFLKHVDIVSVEKKVADSRKKLEGLLELKINHAPRKKLMSKLNTLFNSFYKKSKSYGTRKNKMSRKLRSLRTNNLYDFIDNAVERNKADTTLIAHLRKEKKSLSDYRNKFVAKNIPPMDKLTKDKNSLIGKINNIKKSIKIEYSTGEDVNDLPILKGLMTSIEEIVISLEPNPKCYNSSTLEDLTSFIKSKMADKEVLKVKMGELQQKLSNIVHLKDHNSKSCPKCNHIWNDNYSEKLHIEVKDGLKVQHKLLNELEDEIGELKTKHEEMTVIVTALKSLSSLARSYPKLKKLWLKIIESKVLESNPLGVMDIVREFIYNMSLSKTIDKHEKELDVINGYIKVHTNIDESGAKRREEEEKEITDKIYKLISEINKRKKILTKANKIKNEISSIDEEWKEIKKIEIEVNEIKDKVYISHEQEIINDMIKEVRLELTDSEQKLSNLKLKQDTVVKLEKEIKTLNTELSKVKSLLAELSPTKGLIATSITAFINTFVRNMNMYLDEIWEFPLEIHTPDVNVETMDLDYKFKLSLNNNKPVPDVKKGSSAVRQIINLAYQLTLLNKLGMDNMPLYLDEIGAPMDSSHRINVFKYLCCTLVDSRENQVFIISHDPELYTVFDDHSTEYVVLDENNIDVGVLSSDYNVGLKSI